MKRIIKTAVCILLLGSMALLAACGRMPVDPKPVNTDAPSAEPSAEPTEKTGNLPFQPVSAVNLMAGITARELGEPEKPADTDAARYADFAVRLFKACAAEGENTLVSPLSVLCALSMTANGAEGETLAQMESVLGMTRDELNAFYRSYISMLPSMEKSKLQLANSIWFTNDERFTVNGDFLQTNADVFGADIYKAPFDESTLQDINGWVEKNTDGMIPKILDKIPPEAVMYLINALAFDAEWDRIYKSNEVWNGEFTLEDGTKREAEFMHGDEYTYLNAGNAEGFMKFYSEGKYAFAALLPNEGVSVNELLASLDGAKLMEVLNGAEPETVVTAIPKFETEYSAELSEALTEMGMPDAFISELADLSGIGSSTAGNLYVSRVIHKTFISVDEKGTRAGAATAVEISDETAMLTEHTVVLDRPFVYMLIDCETNLPFFIGTLMDVGE